jgi:hypothetical protein
MSRAFKKNYFGNGAGRGWRGFHGWRRRERENEEKNEEKV